MIKSIKVTNFLGESLEIELRNPEKSGFLIKEITGLGPCKADINAKELATSDGSVFNSARLNSRNIVIKMGLLFNPTVEDSRLKSYRYFPIKKKVKLTIETDNRIAEIEGYVESNEPNIFSKAEETQISIICPDPFFYSAGKDGNNVVVFYGVEDNFEFPFSNESFEENTLELGIVRYSTERSIWYDGDADIGVLITIYVGDVARNLTIYNLRTREYIKFNTDKLESMTGSGLIQGDVLTISTVKGNKYCKLLRNGETINALNCIDKTSTWFALTRGDNIIAYTAEDGGSNLAFKIENRLIYEGV